MQNHQLVFSFLFSTIAWRAMSSALHHEREKERRRIKTVSLDDIIPGSEDLTWGDIVTEANTNFTPYLTEVYQ